MMYSGVRAGTASPRYFPALEGMRALAAIAVIVYHVAIYTGATLQPEPGILANVASRGDIGVPIFFVLSGFLLYRPFAVASLRDAGRPSARHYLWRRGLRVLPAYWVALVVCLAVFNRDTVTGAWEVVRPVLLLHVYERDVLPLGIGQTWSLSAEVAFYLLLPLLAAGLARLGRGAAGPAARARRQTAGLTVLAAVGVGSAVLTHLPSAGDYPPAHLWLPEYAGFFAGGMALAVLLARTEADPLRPPAAVRLAGDRPGLFWAGAAAAFALACTPLTGPVDISYPSAAEAVAEQLLYLVCAVLLVAPCALGGWRAPVLSAPAVRWLGRISYGLFLWHLAFLEGYFKVTEDEFGTGSFAVVLGVVAAGTFVAATLSYYVVECPAQALRPRLGRAPADIRERPAATV